MKKVLLSKALVMTMAFCANAQTDGWFVSNDANYNRDGSSLNTDMPPAHGMDIELPIGNGLLILTALGAGYALRKKRD